MQHSRNYLNANYVGLPVLPQLFSAEQCLRDQFLLLQVTLALLRQNPLRVHGYSTHLELLRDSACCVHGPNTLISTEPRISLGFSWLQKYLQRYSTKHIPMQCHIPASEVN